MDSSGSDRPERRTALAGRELDRYKVEIAALSENSPCRRRAFKRSWCWLHFLLEWTQERRAAWCRSRIRHQVTPRQQALRTSKRHKWPLDDAETSLIWQEACNNCKCVCLREYWPVVYQSDTILSSTTFSFVECALVFVSLVTKFSAMTSLRYKVIFKCISSTCWSWISKKNIKTKYEPFCTTVFFIVLPNLKNNFLFECLTISASLCINWRLVVRRTYGLHVRLTYPNIFNKCVFFSTSHQTFLCKWRRIQRKIPWSGVKRPIFRRNNRFSSASVGLAVLAQIRLSKYLR